MLVWLGLNSSFEFEPRSDINSFYKMGLKILGSDLI